MQENTKKLTPKQKAFAEYYVKTGNATESAKMAGYSERTAKQIGQENLTKPDISTYIAELMNPINSNRIADADEVVAFFTSVMRGQVKDQFGLDAALTDRLKAGVELMKRHEAGKRATDSLAKLDVLLEEFKGAVKSKTT